MAAFQVSLDSAQDLKCLKVITMHSQRYQGDIKIVKYLRGAGAAVDPQSLLRWTPLLGAVFNGDIYLVRYLVENGADVNVRSVQGITPLWAAAFKGSKEKVRDSAT